MRAMHLLVVVPLVLLAACGGSEAGPSASTATTPTTTVPPTEPTATTEAPVPVASIVEWLSDQRGLGRDQVIVDPGWSTLDATVVTAFRQTPSIEGDLIVALDDGRTAPLPPEIRTLLPDPPTGQPDIRVSHLGGDPLVVLVAADRQTIVASRLEATTLRWSTISGLAPLATGERLDLSTAGEHALFVHWDSTVTGTYRQTGQVVAPDGTVTAMAAPPADTPMWFTDDAGGRALLLGLDTVAGESPDLRSPVAFDPVDNRWTTIPAPSWLACATTATGCVWSARHEGPDPQFSVTTPSGVVMTLPDGSYGLLDPVALTWRRLDDPPIAVPGPIVVPVGDERVVVLPGPTDEGTQALGTALWLDLTTGAWTSAQIIDLSGRTPPVWWETRRWGDVLLVGADADEVGNPPAVAIDLTDGTVREPTADELTAWPALQMQMPIDDLITAWQLRPAAA